MKRIKFKALVFLLLAVILLSTIPMTAFAGETETTKKLPSGITYSDIERTIDSYVDANKDTTAAVSISIFDRDGVILEKSYGHMNVEDNIANNADTVMEWGSIGKLLVWVSAMQLYEQGKLDLNADIKTYLPEGFFKKLKYDDKITMLNLMNHNAGWQDICKDLFTTNRENVPDLETALKKTEPMQIFHPGEFVAYSNWGATLAGYIVERVSGMPFYEYVQTNIFAPLQMTKTATDPDLSDNPWVKTEREKLMCYTSDMQAKGPCIYAASHYPAGKATGTISDLRKFAMALIPDENGNSPLFQKAETLAELFTPSSYYSDGKTPSCYHGLWADLECNNKVAQHTGSTIGCVSILKIDLDAGVGTIVMVNQPDAVDYILGMPSKIFEKREIKSDGNLEIDDSIARAYYPSATFRYGICRFFSIIDGPFTITKEKDGSLLIGKLLIIKLPLLQVEPDVYKVTVDDASQSFYVKRDENGKIMSLVTGIDPGSREFFPGSTGKYYFDFFLLFSLVIAGLYGSIALIGILIRRLRKKAQPLGGLRAAVCGSALGALINFVALVLAALSWVMPSAQITVHGLLFILFAPIPVIYAVILAIRFKNLDANKKQKTRLIATAAMGLLMTFSVALLQLWWFWA